MAAGKADTEAAKLARTVKDDLHLAFVRRWGLRQVSDAAGDHLPPLRLPQRRCQHPVAVPGGGW